MLLLLALVIVGKAQTPLLSEGFEDGIPSTWTSLDVDADGFQWTVNGQESATAHTGDKYVLSRSWINSDGALVPNNWLITGQVNIPSTGSYELTYWVCSMQDNFPEEHYGIYVTTSNDYTNPNNYVLLFEETLDETDGGTSQNQSAWQRKVVRLTGYTGNVHIAFRHFNCTDQVAIMLDDVTIDVATPAFEVSASRLQFPTGTVGGSYPTGKFTVSGANLSSNLVLTLPENSAFSISTDSNNYFHQISLPIDNLGDVASTSIYVRFNPTTVSYFESNITISTTNLSSKTVVLTGIAVDCSQYQTIPWYENFSNTYFPPSCWVIDATDSIVSETDEEGNNYYEYTWFKFGAGAAVRGDTAHYQNEHFYSPTFSLSNASGAANFSFGIRTNPRIEALLAGNITMQVKMSADGGNSYETVWDIQDCIEEYDAVWNSNWPVWPVSVNMDQHIGSNDLIKFDFHYTAEVGAADQFIIRDLKFENFFDPRFSVPTADTLNFFSYVGDPQTIVIPVEGRNLSNEINVSTTLPFEVSTDGTNYAATATFSPLGGKLYVRYNPTTPVTFSTALTIQSVYTDTTHTYTDTTFGWTYTLIGDSYDCSTTVLPITESFESEEGTVTAPNTTEYCWSAFKGNTKDAQNNIVNSNDYAYNGNQSFRFSSTNYNAQQIYDQYLISPELTANNPMLVMFNYANASALKDETFCVGYSTTGKALSDFTWEADIVNAANTDWQLYRNTNVPANVKYVAIHYKSQRQAYLYIDNFQMMEVPSCLFPVELRAESTSENSANIAWTAGANETSWEIVYSVYPLNVDDATTTTVNNNNTTLSGLTANTHYQVAVRAICGEEGHSDWSEIVDFWTTTTPATIPYTQTFEDNDADRANWVLVNGNQANYFMYGTVPNFTASKALMITQDGTSNTYLTEIDETMTSHYSTVWAYRDIYFPENNTPGFLLSLNWKCFAEVDYDFGELFIGNATEVTNFERNENIPGFVDVNTAHYTPAGLTKLDRFVGKSQMQTAAYIIPSEGNAGTVKRLYFLWTNDSLSGAETPLAVDNINITIPQFANMSGTVTDANTGAPISGAVINIISNQGFSATTTSDNNGNYLIEDVVVGYYSITVNAFGYNQLNTGYALAAGENNVPLELIVEDCAIIPSNVQYTIENDNMILTWDEHANVTISQAPEADPYYLVGATSSGISYNFGCFHLFTPADLTTVNGSKIVSVSTWVYGDPAYCDYSIAIYVGGNVVADGPMSLAYEQAIAPEDITTTSWIEITLDEPLVIDGSQSLWVGYKGHAHDTPEDYRPILVAQDVTNAGYSDILMWGTDWELYDKDMMVKALVQAPDLSYNVLADGTPIATDIEESEYVVSPYDPTACYQVTTICENGQISDPSACATAASGINDVNNSTSFEVYPNPAHETVNVSTTMDVQKVEIMNYLGQVIFSQNTTNNNFTLNVANYADGVYFIRLSGNDGIATQKLIKK